MLFTEQSSVSKSTSSTHDISGSTRSAEIDLSHEFPPEPREAQVDQVGAGLGRGTRLRFGVCCCVLMKGGIPVGLGYRYVWINATVSSPPGQLEGFRGNRSVVRVY